MTVKLKDETERISFNGRSADITKDNLTLERFEWVKANHPALVSRFVIEDDPKAKANGKGEKE